MAVDYRSEMPPILRDFTSYLVTISGKSPKTADQYYLDLRLFFRFMRCHFGENYSLDDLNSIPIKDIDLDFIKKIKLTDIYQFLDYLSRDREKHKNSPTTRYGLESASRSRKVSAIRSFFFYLERKAQLIESNPAKELELPKRKKTLVKFLDLDSSKALLSHISGKNEIRDYCIIMLFLNCGMRVSELVGINLNDIQGDRLRVLGKGNRERMLYLNDACLDALNEYLPIRKSINGIPAKDANALFISQKKNRISTETVKWLVKKYCALANLDPRISVHKLRHTSATLMYRSGVDLRVLQEVLGHKNLNTTEIYTHVDSDDMRLATRANPLSTLKRDGKKEDAD